MRPVERVPRSCARCGTAFAALQSHINRGRGQYCSAACSLASAREALWRLARARADARFWNWVNKSGGPDACWPWLGKHLSRGYGRFKQDGKSHFAHRKALMLTAGDPPELSLLALHSCDNPGCCNPSHLRWGTDADNQADRRLRGRDRSGRASFDHAEAWRLHREGHSYSQLAARFGVNQSSIGKAIARERKRALLKALIAKDTP